MERTAVQLPERDATGRASIVEFAQRVEELGFETIWAGEAWSREVFTLLAQVACATNRIQLGTGIVNVFSRSPALVAQSIASLDEISAGRAILGLGTSGALVVEQWHGIPYTQPVSRLKEYVEIVRLILRGERLNYTGTVYNLTRGFPLGFTPYRSTIPIFLATLAGRSLRLTGELGDGWLPIYFWPERIDELTAAMREGAAAAGRDFRDITISPYILTAVSHDGDEARRLMRAHVAYYVGGMGAYYHKLVSSYGFVEEAEAIRRAWSERDRAKAAASVSDAMLDAFTISGTVSHCRERLSQYRAWGVQAPVLSMPHGASAEVVRETLAALAPSRA